MTTLDAVNTRLYDQLGEVIETQRETLIDIAKLHGWIERWLMPLVIALVALAIVATVIGIVTLITALAVLVKL